MLDQFKALNINVVAGSNDSQDKAEEVAADLDFPVGYELGKATADKLGSWWEDRRSIIQPSEFLLNDKGRVIHACYATGPIGRINPEDVIRMVNFLNAQKAKQNA